MIHCSEVEGIFINEIRLKKNQTFLNLPLEDIEYSSQYQFSDAGSILNETVTARIRYSPDLEFLEAALVYYVLRLHTNTSTFLVGSTQYPAILTYRNDKIQVNLTFKASKPL